MGFNVGNFVSGAVHAAGKATGGALKAVGDETGKIGAALKKVPAVGPLLHGIWGAAGAPFDLSYRIAKGERLDHALVDHFKNDIKDIREVAPYAKMVISFVPGVGTAVSAAIGAATAIVSGQPISEVVMSAVRGAIPGGDVAASVFDASAAIVSGKGVGAAAIAALPIPEEGKKPLEGALKVAESIAHGKPPGAALVSAAMGALPSEARAPLQALTGADLASGLADAALKAAKLPPEVEKAAQVGIAMGHAQHLQGVAAAASRKPATLAKLASDGQATASRDPVVLAGQTLLRGAGVNGYQIGTGLLRYSDVSPIALQHTRSSLSPADQKGFDLAAALQVGRVANPARTETPAFQAGFFIAKGMQGHDADAKESLMTSVAADPQARTGAAQAVGDVAAARQGTMSGEQIAEDMGYWRPWRRY